MEPEKGKPAPALWFSTKKDSAKPPMWQALFAEGDGDVVNTGLLYVLIAAKDMVKEVELEELIIKIDDDGKGATAKDLLKIPKFKEEMIKLMGTEGNPGPGTNSTTGILRDSHLSNTAIPALKFEVNNLKQSDFLKDLAGHENTIGTLQSFSVIISRRQVRNIGLLLGFKKVEGKKDTVYLPGVVKKMEWKSILKGFADDMCDVPKCGKKATMENTLSSVGYNSLCQDCFKAEKRKIRSRGFNGFLSNGSKLVSMDHWVPIDPKVGPRY